MPRFHLGPKFCALVIGALLGALTSFGPGDPTPKINPKSGGDHLPTFDLPESLPDRPVIQQLSQKQVQPKPPQEKQPQPKPPQEKQPQPKLPQEKQPQQKQPQEKPPQQKPLQEKPPQQKQPQENAKKATKNEGTKTETKKEPVAQKSKKVEQPKQPAKEVKQAKEPKKEQNLGDPLPYRRESTIVNPHPYNVLLSNDKLCDVNGLFLIVYVHTAADHYRRRAIIRQTWGNPASYPHYNIRVLFVMGKTSQVPMMQKAIEFESQTYGDILEEDFEDTYRNLTYKGVAALKWISNHCTNARYILKTDDDVFVNMFTILNHLKNLEGAGYNKNLILCLVWWKMHALREGKWGIPVESYPESLYPPYCSGMAYVMSIDIAKQLYDASFYVKFFWVDDVYISGMLPRAAGLNHTTMIKVYCGKNEMEELFVHPTEWYKYAFTHIHDEDMFLRTWDKISAIAKRNSIPKPSKIEPGWLADSYLPKTEVVKNPDAYPKGKPKEEKKKDEKKNDTKSKKGT